MGCVGLLIFGPLSWWFPGMRSLLAGGNPARVVAGSWLAGYQTRRGKGSTGADFYGRGRQGHCFPCSGFSRHPVCHQAVLDKPAIMVEAEIMAADVTNLPAPDGDGYYPAAATLSAIVARQIV